MSKKIIWTKSDAKRACKMGWLLSESGSQIVKSFPASPFKTDDEAVAWVVNTMVGDDWILGSRLNLNEANWSTCRKALFLCAGRWNVSTEPLEKLRASEAQVIACRQALRWIGGVAIVQERDDVRVAVEQALSTTTPDGWLSPEQAEELKKECREALEFVESGYKTLCEVEQGKPASAEANFLAGLKMAEQDRDAWKACAEEVGTRLEYRKRDEFDRIALASLAKLKGNE